MDKKFHTLARTYGTPLYVYDGATIRRQHRVLIDALNGVSHLICYAVKANSNLSLLKFVRELGCGFDIVSGGELHRVCASGGDPRQVVYAGVAKTREEIDLALSRGIRFFNVESPDELAAIGSRAKALGRVAPVSFRLNPNIEVKTHPYLATGVSSSKFGMDIRTALSLWPYIKANPSLTLVGVDCHIGSNISELDALESAYTQVLQTAHEFESLGATIRHVDLGGGFGVSFSGHYQPLDMRRFGDVVRRLSAGTNYEFIVEPGKFLVAESGTLLTRVLYTKRNVEREFVLVDAGMNDLIRPSLYEAFHKIDLIPQDGVGCGDRRAIVDIVGPVCESGCYFAKQREMPLIRADDLLAIRDAGAYGMSMASTYNSRRLPAEVLVDGRSERLIRKRDEYDSLWREEIECL